MARRIIGTPETPASSDKLVKVSHFYNGSRSNINDSANGTLWTGSWTKEKDAATSWILMEGMIPGTSNYSDQCGIYAELNGADTNNDAKRYQGIYYAGVNHDTGWSRFLLYVHRIIKNDDATQELGAGSRTWKIGWSTRSGSSGDKPFRVMNPNSNDDARNNQYGSRLAIWEYLY